MKHKKNITPRKKGPPPPREHPTPWTSPLWDHLELIRSMRRGRATWKAIAEHLNEAHGIKLKFRTVRNFYARAVRSKLPLGFEAEPATPVVPQPAKPSPKPPAPDALGVDVPHTPGTELFKKTKKRYGK